jgi:adiponectin receptor
MNIWTHIISLLLLPILYLDIQKYYVDDKNIIPLIIAITGAFFVLTGSVIYHTFLCMSKQANICSLKIDMSGICIYIYGYIIPVIYYGFKCYKKIQMMYICVISALTLLTYFQQNNNRKKRIIVYILFGLCAIIPIIHLKIINNNISELFTSFIFLLVGIPIFILRIPERLIKYKFDYFGSSHQIWHILISVSIYFGYRSW